MVGLAVVLLAEVLNAFYTTSLVAILFPSCLQFLLSCAKSGPALTHVIVIFNIFLSF